MGTGVEAAGDGYILRCVDLEKSYGERRAVRGVSFHIATGETYGLLGPNGAGKTTTIAMICGLLSKDGGRVAVDGRRLETNSTEAKGAIGYVPQDLAIYPDLTARENLRFFGRLYGLGGDDLGRRADEVLGVTGLADRANERTDGFSGGMKRRLTIARSLVNDPDLLLLDEPTTGLDPKSKRDVQTFLEALRSEHGTTILLTSHDMAETERLCSRIGFLAHGRLIAEGTARELKQRAGASSLEDAFIALAGEKLDEDEKEDGEGAANGKVDAAGVAGVVKNGDGAGGDDDKNEDGAGVAADENKDGVGVAEECGAEVLESK